MIIAGIDPGKSGALAVVNEVSHCETANMPLDDTGVDGAAVARFLGDRDAELAVVERAQAMPAHVKGQTQGVSSTFKYGMAYGELLGALKTARIPFVLVTPTQWKRGLDLLKTNKHASKAKACQLLPRAAAQFTNHNRAEAALIAWWWLHRDRAVNGDDAGLLSQPT